MDTSKLFRLNWADLSKGFVTAALAGAGLAVVQVLSAVLGAPGFDVFALNWTSLVHDMVNAAIIGAQAGFIGYITKNFLSDKDGAVLGKFGGRAN